MAYVTGFILWLFIAVVAATVVRFTYRTPFTPAPLTYVLTIFGTFVGGMLGTSAYVYHDPNPMRPGGLIGAVLGAFLFGYMYHFTARKAT